VEIPRPCGARNDMEAFFDLAQRLPVPGREFGHIRLLPPSGGIGQSRGRECGIWECLPYNTSEHWRGVEG
jgi:hypothetical protein